MPRTRVSLRAALVIIAAIAVASFAASKILHRRDGPIVTRRLSTPYYSKDAIEIWKLDDPNDPKPSQIYSEDHPSFAELVQEVYASTAQDLPSGVIVVGRYVPGEAFKRKDLEWLIRNGYPNANLHVVADVVLMKESSDSEGQWFFLVSVDDYWTAAHYRDIYDFVVHVRHDGTIRLMNPNDDRWR